MGNNTNVSGELSSCGASYATVTYWAAARAAAGVVSEERPLTAATTVQDLLGAAAARHGAELARVLSMSSVLLDDCRVDREAFATTLVRPGAEVQVLPPFAGG
ncbi:MAG: MoaD/ThiS family protein [Nocardioidaceae bacterium]